MIRWVPHLLSPDWMLIGSEVSPAQGCRIALLAIAPDGSLVAIEFMRDRTPATLRHRPWTTGPSENGYAPSELADPSAWAGHPERQRGTQRGGPGSRPRGSERVSPTNRISFPTAAPDGGVQPSDFLVVVTAERRASPCGESAVDSPVDQAARRSIGGEQ